MADMNGLVYRWVAVHLNFQNLQKHQESNLYNRTFLVVKKVVTNPNTRVFKKNSGSPNVLKLAITFHCLCGMSRGSTQTSPPPLVCYRRRLCAGQGCGGQPRRYKPPRLLKSCMSKGRDHHIQVPSTPVDCQGWVWLAVCLLENMCMEVDLWSSNSCCLGPSERELDKEGEGRQGGKRRLVSK